MPDVTTRSPGFTSEVPGTYSMRSVPSPKPTMTPCVRVRSTSAPAAALRSISSCTFDARSLGRMTRPTTPAGEITAMSAARPDDFPLSMVTVRNSGLAAAAMISAAVVSRPERSRSSSNCRRLSVRCATARSSCRRTCSVCTSCLRAALSVWTCCSATYPVQTPRTPSTTAIVARCTSENAPNVTACARGRPEAVLTCTEMRTTCSRMAAASRTPGRCLMSQGPWSGSRSNRWRSCAAGRTHRASCQRPARPTTAGPPRSTPAGRSPRAGACRGS